MVEVTALIRCTCNQIHALVKKWQAYPLPCSHAFASKNFYRSKVKNLSKTPTGGSTVLPVRDLIREKNFGTPLPKSISSGTPVQFRVAMAIARLPEELITDILSRLPAKSIGQSRVLRKLNLSRGQDNWVSVVGSCNGLALVVDEEDNFVDTFIDIYSAKMGSWKRLSPSPYDHAVPCNDSGTFLNGALHLLGSSCAYVNDSVISAFNLASEVFEELPPPATLHKDNFWNSVVLRVNIEALVPNIGLQLCGYNKLSLFQCVTGYINAVDVASVMLFFLNLFLWDFTDNAATVGLKAYIK
ncbi:hypothetical protein M9H77_36761 [Catharanthus roseus]|uniref:Uncharacterized protein n=1 Tax=Catharanthus roseus TaxID=4058 RepID=A0ACB9ZVA4_CATRO|nr:hypothetical protein M9H77_36761 [Catharanthus roseus]